MIATPAATIPMKRARHTLNHMGEVRSSLVGSRGWKVLCHPSRDAANFPNKQVVGEGWLDVADDEFIQHALDPGCPWDHSLDRPVLRVGSIGLASDDGANVFSEVVTGYGNHLVEVRFVPDELKSETH